MAVVLIADQPMFQNEKLCVCVGGTFEHHELVAVYQIDDPEKAPMFSYPASYIATGEIIENALEIEQDWDGLVTTFRGTLTFQKCFTTTNANAWSLLLMSLMQTHHLHDLYFAFQNVRASIPEPYQLTPDDIVEINQILEQYHIPLVID